MRCHNPKRPARTAHHLLDDAAAIVDELWPHWAPEPSRRVDQLLAAADRLAEQEACW